MDFRDRARFGHTGYGLENTKDHISSDRLFSAIILEWIDIYGREDIEALTDGNGLILTNAMPYISDTYYLPRPAMRFTEDLSDRFYEQYRKNLKSLSWMTAHTIGKIVNSELLDKDEILHELKASERLKSMIKIDISQKVKINHSEDNRLFRVRELYFADKSGLYFIFNIAENLEAKFNTVINSLGVTGIGSDRSTGAGSFSPAFATLSIEQPENPDRYMSLSEVIPDDEEVENLQHDKSGILSYRLVKKAGRVYGTDHFKRPGFAFSAGSVFPFDIKGKTDDISDDDSGHPVYRYGRAFNIAIKGGKK